MDSKLTLSLDQEIIARAKEYAKSRKISLSRLIESYLTSLTNEDSNDPDISPLVKSLSGVTLPHDFDQKESYTNFLSEKHK